MAPDEEIRLFKKLSGSDTDALKTLFTAYRSELYHAANLLLRDTDLAEDAVQETFIRLWVNRKSLQEVLRPSNYLYRILLNYATDLLRSQDTRARIYEQAVLPRTQSSQSTTENMVDFSETSRRLAEGLKLLPPQQRTAYELVEMEGLSLEEVSGRMDLSVNTVKSHLQRAREFIRQYFSDIAIISLLLSSWK